MVLYTERKKQDSENIINLRGKNLNSDVLLLTEVKDKAHHDADSCKC